MARRFGGRIWSLNKAMRKFATALLFFLLLPARAAMIAAEEEGKEKKAEELYNTGYLANTLGWHREAIQLLEKSLAIMPTAEAYTYLGWT